MRYLPKSDRERREMLAAVGVSSIDDLFECIPEQVRLKRPLDLPRALSEPEIIARFRQWAGQNAEGHLRLLGAGVYDHFRSVVVDSLISRGEFFTAYTPYQAEISQGTLQAIFEFQTLMCQLTGQEVANASMYDGSTALAESVLMALRITRRQRVLVSSAVHPEYRQVLRTYLQGQQIDLDELPMRADGRLDLDTAAKAIDDQTATLALQSPNFFGCLEEIPAVAELCRSHGALLVATVPEPVSLGLVRPPAEADIVALEAQPLGLPPSYGGPYAGVIASRQKFVRSLPGRLAGQTTDADGRRGFVLTLSTREQHIRREKATSNICTNQALCALAVTIFLSIYGKEGLHELAQQNLAKAHYLADELRKLAGVRLPFSAPFFNEFVVDLGREAATIHQELVAEKIIAGVPLARWYSERRNELLLCVTETTSRDDLDRFVTALKEALVE
jgi:glycine dehydrogenase subunit 1